MTTVRFSLPRRPGISKCVLQGFYEVLVLVLGNWIWLLLTRVPVRNSKQFEEEPGQHVVREAHGFGKVAGLRHVPRDGDGVVCVFPLVPV